jgi:hypothetical protein
MAGLKRDVDRIIRQLQRPDSGCDVGKTNRGHWKVSKPGRQNVIISPQPSDPRSIRNARADLRRYLSVDV